MGKINFDKLTKGELDYLFKANEWRFQGMDFESQIKRYRAEKEREKMADALIESARAGRELAVWLEQHKGMEWLDVPASVIEEGARLERKAKEADKRYFKLWHAEKEAERGED